MSRSHQTARELLAAAGDSLARLRQEAGVTPSAPLEASDAGHLAGGHALKSALEAAHAKLRDLTQELAAAHRRAEECEAENRRLSAELKTTPREEALSAQLMQVADEAKRQHAELESRSKILVERVTLQQAEVVRLESLRRKAEAAVAEGEKTRRSLEETLRRELRAAHAALDEAAAAAGAREGQVRGELEDMHKRLDSATERMKEVERESRRLYTRAKAEEELLNSGPSLKDLARQIFAERERANESLALAQGLRTELKTVENALRSTHAALERSLASAGSRDAQSRTELTAMQSKLESAPIGEDFSRLEQTVQVAPDFPEGAASPEMETFVFPSLEPVLEEGWARLLRLIRPPVEAAYAHLRRLSAAPLAAGPRALVRLSAVSLSQAAEVLTVIELVLSDSPSISLPSSMRPTLEHSLSTWEPALRRQGIALSCDLTTALPDVAHEPRALRAVIYQILRNALEVLPRGARLSVRAARVPDGGVRLEFFDDGPGFPAAWLDKRFEPFAAARRGHAGLGLAMTRRTLRRWGGEAEAGNGPGDRGARLVLLFAPPAPAGPEFSA